jgi:archaellum component FlaF (FlaF/FlaG flagellin family)
MRAALAVALFVLESLAFCQSSPASQYPDPSQYPPGQYPPGQYPPGQYPPNQYPSRLPGGIPIGIPVPQINLPKRKPKEDKKEDPSGVKITLASVDGALRKLGEKDLLLETNPTRILKFRLLVKTQFKNSEGEPVRDSLLHPGDRLSIQVNADVAETALKVILLRAGSAPEREAASKPVEEAKISTPTNDDLTNIRTTLAHETAPPPTTSSGAAEPAPTAPDRPSISERPDIERTPVSRLPSSGDPDEIISDAREAAVNFTADLPNFLVQQVTTRYQSNTRTVNWQAVDTVTADVACVNGKEDYRNIAINGRPATGPVERTGTWSTGEFAVTLQDILAPATAATFMKQREEMLGSRSSYVFDLAVEQSNSHWVLVGPTGRQYRPAYRGTIWIDKETRRVLRIEQIAKSAQSIEVPYDKAESVVEYGFVNIEGKSYLLPTQSENLACLRGSPNCVRNVINFQNYRKFSASSDIKYDKFRPTL